MDTPVTNGISTELRSFYANHGLDIDALVVADQNKDNDKGFVFASRFVRLNPRFGRDETLSRLKEELGGEEPIPVSWLDDRLGFYVLPGKFRLVQSACYQEGRIYGMDVSSGAAVGALLSDRYDGKPGKNQSTTCANSTGVPTQQELAAEESNSSGKAEKEPLRVLDLCCAPGLKLCAIGDFLSQPDTALKHSSASSTAVVVGVDVSEHRIALCKKILHKYHLQSSEQQEPAAKSNEPQNIRMRLYCADGTKFHQSHDHDNQLPKLVFDSNAAVEETAVTGKRKRMNKSARARERKRLKTLWTMDFETVSSSDMKDDESNDQQVVWKPKLFDRVLVDAECSTDGSLKHIAKQINSNQQNNNQQQQIQRQPEQVAPLLTDATQLSKLVELQKQLAASGFRLLKPRGTMVYSTCSLSEEQNEKVVAWLLKTFCNEAELIPVEFSSSFPSETATATDVSASISGNPKVSEGPLGMRFEPCLPLCHDAKGTSATTGIVGGGFFLAKIRKKES